MASIVIEIEQSSSDHVLRSASSPSKVIDMTTPDCGLVVKSITLATPQLSQQGGVRRTSPDLMTDNAGFLIYGQSPGRPPRQDSVAAGQTSGEIAAGEPEKG